MSDETIVAIYDTPAHAELAAADLRQAGVPTSAINVHAETATTGTGTPTVAPREEGFWSSLFGGSPDHDTAVYDRSMASGGSVLTVQAPEQHVTRVLEILESHNPIDIDDRATSYGIGQTSATTTATPAASLLGTQAVGTATAATDAGKLQLAEESLSIGKRVVNRGGTRIRRFVVERPVEETVSLRTEKVVLERIPVTDARPAIDSFSNKTIEMTEMSEEAVVAKIAHVYEEVGLRKEATERVETVHDTVRKEEVEVEQIPVTETVSTTERLVPPTPPIK